MKARIDLQFLRTLMSVRVSLADRSIFRGLSQTRDQLLREHSRDRLVALITQGWDSYGLEGEADPDRARHDIPSCSHPPEGQPAVDGEGDSGSR